MKLREIEVLEAVEAYELEFHPAPVVYETSPLYSEDDLIDYGYLKYCERREDWEGYESECRHASEWARHLNGALDSIVYYGYQSVMA